MVQDLLASRAKFELNRQTETKFYVGSMPKEGFLMKGVADGVRGMCFNEVREMIIPPELAFGKKATRAYGSAIPADQWIYGEIKLVINPRVGGA
jgi:FKBP-type peptidyl-prolyl cis-trans isomerase